MKTNYKKKIIILTRRSLESDSLIHKIQLINSLSLSSVCYENNVRGRISLFFKKIINFIKKKKYFTIIHFIISIPIFLFINHKTKYLQKKRWGNLNNRKFKDIEVKLFNNINSIEVSKYISSMEPDIILVYGTRILDQSIFNLSSDITINIHMGITDHYRGSRSEFWSLYNKDYTNIGFTIHRVDSGIDTGQILWQSKLKYNYENHILLRIKNIENVINDLPIFFKKYFEGNLELDTYKKLKKGNFYSTPLMFDYLKLYFQ